MKDNRIAHTVETEQLYLHFVTVIECCLLDFNKDRREENSRLPLVLAWSGVSGRLAEFISEDLCLGFVIKIPTTHCVCPLADIPLRSHRWT